MKAQLSPQQKKVYIFLVNYIDKYQHSPTCREMAQELNLHHTTINTHLETLKKKGYVDWLPGEKRTIRLVGKFNSLCPPLSPTLFDDLNENDCHLYVFIRYYISNHQKSPSIKDIMLGLGLKSSRVIQQRLNRLRQKGYVDWLDNKRRSIRVLK